jgi:RNA polymerase sigma-70 factor (ECF subfamily)
MGRTTSLPHRKAPGLYGMAEVRAAMNKANCQDALDDNELIARAAAGDRRAFDEIVKRHGPFALRVAVRLTSDMALAEDIAQEAMMRAWDQAVRFDARRAQFTTWLYRIIVNLCIDHHRRIRPGAMPENFDQVDPSPGADEQIETDERHAALRTALASLPVRQRAAVVLVYNEGMSGAEAARILNSSTKAIERLLARARATLREQLKFTD